MINVFTVQHYEHATNRSFEVPIRLMIYEDYARQVRLVYDLPSSLMSRLGNEELMVSARKLDEKLRLLAERSTAAAA
jgi:uncharacterized protein (DUF302 family)